jgi:hypothetical protein
MSEQLLRREAEALINGAPAGATGPDAAAQTQ